jgi:hypothetical protein
VSAHVSALHLVDHLQRSRRTSRKSLLKVSLFGEFDAFQNVTRHISLADLSF